MTLLRAAVMMLVLGTTTAQASLGECPDVRQRTRFEHFRDRLAEAPTPEAARGLAQSKIDMAQTALSRAEKIVGDKPEFVVARDRLDAFESRVGSAPDQAAVALEFDNLLAGSGGGCSYDTTEVVVIVIGFILGILPGILFLFLFC